MRDVSSLTVETAYGPIRSSNGGFFLFTPQRGHLERSCRVSIPNPWGTAFDEWGQDYFTDTSDPNLRWMLHQIKVPYGDFAPNPWNLLEQHRVRPTSGLEFVSSRHFPDEAQGDVLINNTIGFRGAKQHRMVEDGAVMRAIYRHDLMISTDRNFRPVDMEFAPDGSLYVVDWHNALIGHMQHNARDVNRDHAHGRVFRQLIHRGHWSSRQRFLGLPFWSYSKISRCPNTAPGIARAGTSRSGSAARLVGCPGMGRFT